MILALCVVGTYALNNSLFDVGIMLIAGVVGYFMQKGGYPASPVVLALIMGGNLKIYGNAFSGTDYWTSTQLMGVHEKFNPETGISELGTGKSSGLCVEYY
ncbi:tripartite tricarboxylate transporter permease [Escherichia coli]|nr:tripartite tricarboxylate transporter permease [Escherichia coli]MCW4405748.1 tripartite tricarboxylate transporter permease [Escherichia coli]MDF6453944.1 tripartite tricarboxylate transporter permease [Escherichia coli]MDF6526318.1 tripartite tricarboxylate transporter permease [Escherichia coli]MDF8276430.1 tripartite tricarboxylate transporter permease [Escherichia coli]MDO7772595.1 tripartite tricarboxylate transporter permease [Escherichia coli]